MDQRTSDMNVEVSSDFVPYSKDTDFDGAEDILEKEREFIDHHRSGDQSKRERFGLALSGGGIRSATFALGVLQRLAKTGWLERFDYLSTVSGGGYIGSSLTWFLHNTWESAKEKIRFDVTEDDFPFGTHRRGKKESAGQQEEPGGGRDKAAVLRALRQNGNFLAPGNGLTIFSLLGVVLRGTFLSLFVYVPLLILLFFVLDRAYILRPATGYPESWSYLTHLSIPSLGTTVSLNIALTLAIVLIAVSILGSVWFALKTYSARPSDSCLYANRRLFEVTAGRVFVTILGLLALGSLPFVRGIFDDPENAAFSGILGTVLGFISSVAAFLKSGLPQKTTERRSLLPLLAWPAAAFLLYGVLLLSYMFAQTLITQPNWKLSGFFLIWCVFGLLVGRYVNLNYVSIHRFYRDRLMETYLPNVLEVVQNGATGLQGASHADRAPLSDMCRPGQASGPYHIVNTNVVLVESLNKKFRGRGGDNFVLSPLYCGSNATGWRGTGEFMNNSMTLASAMAISGAAANPDTGVGGEGPTRNPVLSLLMSLLNIRLGYWAPHPDPRINRWQNQAADESALKNMNPLQGYRPNFFVPMLTSTALVKLLGNFFCKIMPRLISPHNFGKNENNRFIELTDGGHFENLGLYELIRRRLTVIVVCDGAADPDFKFADLANAIEKVRVDFGTLVKLDVAPLIPSDDIDAECGVRCAERGFVTGEIIYPDDTKGLLIYLKTTFTKGMYSDLVSYKKRHPQFPDETTADQFFDEKQFEAYRELGYFIARSMTKHCTLKPREPVRDQGQQPG